MRTGVRTPMLAAAAGACVVAPALMAADVDSPLRVAAALTLFALAPGAALAGVLAPRPAASEIVLLVGVSLAVSTVAAQLMLTLHLWSPLAGACVLAAACLPPIALQLMKLRRRRSEVEG
jgi:hypothetical protein